MSRATTQLYHLTLPAQLISETIEEGSIEWLVGQLARNVLDVLAGDLVVALARFVPIKSRRHRAASLDDGVLAGGVLEPLRTQLGDALLRLEVHVDQAEAVAVAVDPLEIVLGAPVEVAVYRHAFVGCPLEIVQASSHEHHSV